MNSRVIYCLLFACLLVTIEGMAQTYFLKNYKAKTTHQPTGLFPNGDPDDDHPDYEFDSVVVQPPLQAKMTGAAEWKYFYDGTIVQDIAVSEKEIWAATYNGGLIKTDRLTGEQTFFYEENAPIENNVVNDVLLDRAGNVWVLTIREILRFDGANWTIYVPGTAFLIENYPIHGAMELLEDLEGNIWVSARNYVARFDGENWMVERPFNTYSYQIRMAPDGTLWMTCNAGKLLRWDGSAWVESPNFDHLGLKRNTIDDFEIDQEGNLWLLGGDQNYQTKEWMADLVVYDGTQIIASYSLEDGTLPVYFSNIEIDEKGTVWLGAKNECNVVYTLKEDVFTPFESVLKGQCINRDFSIKNGELWIAKDGLTLRIDKDTGKLVEEYVVTNAFLFRASRVTVDTENVKWFGTNHNLNYYVTSNNGGLIRYDGKSWQKIAFPENQQYSTIGAAKKGGLWVRTYDVLEEVSKLYWYHDQEWELVPTDILGEHFSIFGDDDDGRLWVKAGEMEIGYREGGEWHLQEIEGITIEGMEWRKEVFTDLLVTPKNQVWAITSMKRVFKYNDATDAWEYQLTLDESNDLRGVSLCYGYRPPSLYTDRKGNVWVNGERFLAKFDGEHWTYFTDEDFDMDCGIVDIEEDEQGNIWVLISQTKVVKYDGKTWVEVNSENSGLPDTWISDLEIDQDENIWFIGGGRASVYRAGGVVNIDGGSSNGFVDDELSPITSLELYPNPIPTAYPLTIGFELVENSKVQIALFNALGQQVFMQNKGQLAVGEHRFEINTDLEGGFYFVVLRTEKGQLSQSFIVNE